MTMDEDFFREFQQRQGSLRPPMPMRPSRRRLNEDAIFEASIKHTGRGIVWLFLLPVIASILMLAYKLFSPMIQSIIESFQK